MVWFSQASINSYFTRWFPILLHLNITDRVVFVKTKVNFGRNIGEDSVLVIAPIPINWSYFDIIYITWCLVCAVENNVILSAWHKDFSLNIIICLDFWKHWQSKEPSQMYTWYTSDMQDLGGRRGVRFATLRGKKQEGLTAVREPTGCKELKIQLLIQPKNN